MFLYPSCLPTEEILTWMAPLALFQDHIAAYLPSLGSLLFRAELVPQLVLCPQPFCQHVCILAVAVMYGRLRLTLRGCKCRGVLALCSLSLTLQALCAAALLLQLTPQAVYLQSRAAVQDGSSHAEHSGPWVARQLVTADLQAAASAAPAAHRASDIPCAEQSASGVIRAGATCRKCWAPLCKRYCICQQRFGGDCRGGSRQLGSLASGLPVAEQ